MENKPPWFIDGTPARLGVELPSRPITGSTKRRLDSVLEWDKFRVWGSENSFRNRFGKRSNGPGKTSIILDLDVNPASQSAHLCQVKVYSTVRCMMADKIVGTTIRLIIEATGCGGLRALPGSKNEFIYLRGLLLSQTLPKSPYTRFISCYQFFAKKRLN